MLNSSRLASCLTIARVKRARHPAAASPVPAVAGFAIIGISVHSWKIRNAIDSLISRLVYWTCTPRSFSAIAIPARRFSRLASLSPTLSEAFPTKAWSASPSQMSRSGTGTPLPSATR